MHSPLHQITKRPDELPDIETVKDIFLELEDYEIIWGRPYFQKSYPVSYAEVVRSKSHEPVCSSSFCDNTLLNFKTNTFMVTWYQIDVEIYSKSQTTLYMSAGLGEVIQRLEDFLGDKPKISYRQKPIVEISSYRQVLEISMNLYKCDKI